MNLFLLINGVRPLYLFFVKSDHYSAKYERGQVFFLKITFFLSWSL